MSREASVLGTWRLQRRSKALQDAPTTTWGGLPVPPGWCARAMESAAPLRGPSERANHRLDTTPRPLGLVCPGFGDCSPPRVPFKTRPPPPGQDSLSTHAIVPGPWRLLPPSQALQDTPTTAWAGHPGWFARGLETAASLQALHVARQPPGQDSLSPHAGLPGPWRLLPPRRPFTTPCVPRLVCPCLGDYCLPSGPSQRTDHRLGSTTALPVPLRCCARTLGAVAPCRPPLTHRLAPGQDSLSPQVSVPGPWEQLPCPPPPLTHRPPPGRDTHPPGLVCPSLGSCCPPSPPRPSSKEFHCPRPPGGEALYCKSCTPTAPIH